MEEDFDFKIEQHAVTRFFVWKGKSPKETIDKVCNVNTKGELLLALWHLPFISGIK